jgi:hypothetical protein
MLRLVAQLERATGKLPVFATLTFPDTWYGELGDTKTLIERLGKRMKRQFGDKTGFLWRLELRRRKSGERVGAIMPHFHLLVFNLGRNGVRPATVMAEFRQWLSRAWWEIVGTGDPAHLRAGTNAQYMKSWRTVVCYTSKYVAKTDGDEDGITVTAADHIGRWWGVVNRAALPWATRRTVLLTASEALRLWSIFRRRAGLDDNGWSLPSVSIFCDGSWIWENWQRLAAPS